MIYPSDEMFDFSLIGSFSAFFNFLCIKLPFRLKKCPELVF